VQSASSATNNRYFRCLTHHPDPIPWDIYESGKDEKPDYLRGVLQAMERHLQTDGLTFYITWDLDELPSYGKDAVAIAMGDEWSQVPSYAHRVLATFKPYGVRPQLEARPFRHPSYLNALLTAKYLRVLSHYLPGALYHKLQILKRRLKGKRIPPIYEIPLGYGNQLDLPIRPIQKRSRDVFFAGSVKQGGSSPLWSSRRWIRSPKNVAREQMLDALTRLSETHPSIDIQVHTNARFVLNALEYGLTEPGEVLDAEEYSNTLMNTKICLVPRGTSPETFRFFEGLRYGCVLITERLPSRWFYDGAPVIQVDEWSELRDIAPQLLADTDRMQKLHEASLEWWNAICSEEAVGQFMADRINVLT